MEITRPSAKEIKSYLKEWDGLEHYATQERAINTLFKTFPKNNNVEEVITKACCLNAFYSTNIKKLYPVAKHIVDLNIDKRLEKKDLSVVNEIAKCEVKEGVVRDNYSFATKYCCHQNEEYPIYDSFVEKMLIELNKQEYFADFKKSDLRDYEKFYNVLQEFKKHFKLEQFTLREIDKYLWQAGKHYFPKNFK